MYQLRKKSVFLSLALALSFSASVPAAVLEHFYQVEIPAREGQERSQALREALQLMIARQAGSNAIEGDALDAAMQDPQTYMRRIGGTDAGGVRVEFEPTSLRDLLSDAGLPLLGPNRPTVMLWAVENTSLDAELLGQGSAWTEALAEAARRRAVALSLPLADLEDRSLVEVDTIRQADGDTLKRASERYDASAVLALNISEAAGEAILEWTWWLNDQSDSGRIVAASNAAAADELMLAVADRVIAQYAVSPSDAEERSDWEVVVEGVDSLDEFAALQRTMQQLGSKQSPRVLNVNGDQVRLAIDFAGSEAQLERLLDLDQRLRRMPAPAPEPQSARSETLPPESADVIAEEGMDSAPSAGQESTTLDEEAMALEAETQIEQAVTEPAPRQLFFRWR